MSISITNKINAKIVNHFHSSLIFDLFFMEVNNWPIELDTVAFLIFDKSMYWA